MPNARVLLLGDFIRLSYQPLLASELAKHGDVEVDVLGPVSSTGSSADLAETIDRLLDEFKPDVVHFNAGLDDVRWFRAEQRHAVPIGEYELNLQRVVDACKGRLGNDVIFALTTPVIDRLQCDQPGTSFDRSNRDIEEYNIAATQIMLADNVLINHLDRAIAERDDEYLGPDGVSLTEAGRHRAAAAVASCITTMLR